MIKEKRKGLVKSALFSNINLLWLNFFSSCLCRNGKKKNKEFKHRSERTNTWIISPTIGSTRDLTGQNVNDKPKKKYIKKSVSKLLL